MALSGVSSVGVALSVAGLVGVSGHSAHGEGGEGGHVAGARAVRYEAVAMDPRGYEAQVKTIVNVGRLFTSKLLDLLREESETVSLCAKPGGVCGGGRVCVCGRGGELER